LIRVKPLNALEIGVSLSGYQKAIIDYVKPNAGEFIVVAP